MPLYLGQDDAGTSSFSLQDFEPSWSSKMNAAVREAWLESYGPAGLDYARSRLGGGNEPKLSAIDAADAIKKSGVKFGASVADGQYTRTQLDLLLERQREMAAIKDVRERTPWDISSPLRGIGMFGAGIVDPINLATAFVPWTRSLSILNGARAGLVSESLATRSLSRAVIGGADAAISTVALEAPYSFIRNELGDDYGALDSMANIAFGAAFGSAVNVGAGAGMEGFRRLTGRTQEFDRFRGLSNDDIQLVQAFDEVKDRLGPRDIQRILETYSPEMRRAAGYNDTAGRAGMPEIAAERMNEALPAGAPPDGRPVPANVYYHGTSQKFSVIDPSIGATPGAWFSSSASDAGQFGPVRAFTVDVKNPATLEQFADARRAAAAQGFDPMEDRRAFNDAVIRELEEQGFDGVQDQAFSGAGGAGEGVVAALRAEQVRELAPDEVAAFVAKGQTAANTVTKVAPETREAALRSSVAQSVDGRMVDVDAIVGMDDSVGTATRADVVASAERNFEPEQVALANFDASAAVQARLDAAPKWDGVKDAEAALGEAQTLLADTVKAGDQAFKYSRGQGGAEKPGVGVTEGNKLGFEPDLRVKITLGNMTLPQDPLLLTGTNNKNAGRQIDAIDGILAMFPNADQSPEEWSRMMAYALASDEVPVPPYAFLRDINSDNATNKLSRLTPGQIADADHGFENAAEFRKAYLAKELEPVTTGKLFMWSFLSRGVSPYTQEALFIDAFAGIDGWIRMAAEGRFDPEAKLAFDIGDAAVRDDLAERLYLSDLETYEAARKKAEKDGKTFNKPEPARIEWDVNADGTVNMGYRAWARTVSPKGSGQPGSGASHNLNAFGELFLAKMSEAGPNGISHLQRLHDMMSDPSMTGKQIRREFMTFGEGVGIDNKVVSFTLLVAGFDDVMVLDRVQIRQLWDDGRFAGKNLYDGRKDKSGKQVAGSALSDITYGARGLLIYEAVERALASRVKKIYADLGREADGSIGRYHWESWVADSQQEAAHGSLGAILPDARGDDRAISNVTAKQGEYGAYEYGAMYGRGADGIAFFAYNTPDGQGFEFSVPAFRAFLAEIKKPGAGVVPGTFKVTESGNAPWYTRPEVNQQRLAEVAARFADRKGGTGEGTRPVQETVAGQDLPDDAGSRYARGADQRLTPEIQLAEALRLSFGDSTSRLLEAGAIRIVATPADIPGGPHPGDVKGATAPDGTVYIVAQNVGVAEARGMVLHEVGVHVGMERMLGADVFQSVLSELDGAIARGESWAMAARSAVPSDTPAGLVREEQLAYLVQNSPELPIVQRIIAAVRAWAFRTFEFARERMTLTEADFRAMAVSALHHAAKGEDVGVLAGAYARAQKNYGTDSVEVTQEPNGRYNLVEKSNPGIRLSTQQSPDGDYMTADLDAFNLNGEVEELGGKGTATRLYLRALQIARDNYLGWQSSGVMSDATNRMYERLIALGIPFQFDGRVYDIDAFSLRNADVSLAQGDGAANEQAAIDELSTWAGNSLMADSATGRPIVFYMPAPDGPAAGFQVMPFPENGIEGVLINPYKPEAVEDATSPTSWMNEVRVGELADDAGAVPVVVRGTKTVSEDQLYALRKQYPGKSDASIASAEGILFVELQDVQSSYKIVLNPQGIRAVPESLLARIDTQEGNKFGARSGGTREAFMEGFDTLDIDTVDIAMDDAGAADAGAAQPGFRYSRGETPEPAKPADELKPYDDAVKRAKSYASVLRAAADKLDNDAQATEAMRAALPDISPAEITDLLDQLRRQVKGLRGVARTAREAMASEDVAAGLQADAMRAADMLANNLEMAAVIEKRNAALNMHVRLKATAYVNQFREAGLDFEGFRGLLVGTERKRAGGRISVDAEQKGFRGEWLGGLIADLEKQDLMRQFTSGAFDRDISIALWNIGKGGDNSKLAPEAVKIAEVVHKYQTDARNTRNRFGAWIRDLQGYITRQSHDMLKIRDAGEKAYKEFTLPRLDLERSMRDFDGTADDFLTRVYDDFATGSHMKTIAGEDDIAALGRGSSLARRESVSRVLYFKDGNASFEYNEKFGQGRVAESVLQGLDQAGQSAGLLKILGTNPEATVRRLFDEYAESLRGDPERRSKFLQKRKELDNLLAQVDGSVNIPGNVTAARISSFIRAWQAMAKLGGALISSVTDLANYAAEMRFGQNQNLFTGVLDGIGALTQGRAKGEKQQILSSLGVFHESTLGSVFARFDSPDLLGGKMSAAMQMFFKLNGLTWWTESLRDGYALTHSHYLATNAHQSFDKLPDALRDMLGLYNIDAGKWDVLRIATMQEADGREYMTPDALRTVPRAALENYIVSVGRTVSDASVANLVDDLSSALRTMTIDRMHHAVIEPGARTRAFMLRGTQPGTVPGELLRFIGQFKSFPVALIQSTLGREVYGRGYDTISDYMKNGKGDMVGLASFIALSTAMGYAAMSIKDLLLGKNPRPVDDPRTWAAAFVQGGGLGIYGDFLFAKYNRMGGTLTGSLAGPVANMVDTVADLWTRIRTGDDVAATAFNAALQNTPFMSLFYVRSALNYLVLYKLQEAMNPGFLRRMEKRAERENGQTYYMPPTAVVR